MSVKFTVDPDRTFRRSLQTLAARSKMSGAQVVNQLLIDIAERCFDTAPRTPYQEIHNDIRQVVADRQFAGQLTPAGTARLAQSKAEGLAGRTIKSGKNKGGFQRFRQNRQLQAIHLIVNKKRGKGRGLYGKDMMKYAGAVTRRRTGASGSLKIAFLPAIRALMQKAKFKFSWATKAKGIKRWPGSTGWGGATPAQPSTNPVGEFRVNYKVHTHRQSETRATPLLQAIMANALAWKRAKTIERANQIIEGDVSSFNRSR